METVCLVLLLSVFLCARELLLGLCFTSCNFKFAYDFVGDIHVIRDFSRSLFLSWLLHVSPRVIAG